MTVSRDISLFSYYLLREDPVPEPVFPGDVAARLAPHVRTALARAGPEETVVFYLQHEREDGIPLVTSGGLVHRDGRLVLALAHANTPMTSGRKRDEVRGDPLRPRTEPDFRFVAGPGQTVSPPGDRGSGAPDPALPALVLDLRSLARQPESRAGRAASDETPAPASGTIAEPAAAEEKLRRLRSWHEQGLITEDEYRRAREAILRRF